MRGIFGNRLSQYWIFANYMNQGSFPIWAFPEWALSNHYYEDLVNWGKPEELLFEQYKMKMDLKFPDSSITEKAGIGDQDWLLCSKFMDA